MLKIIKSYMMPIAMLIGVVFYEQVSVLAFLTPYLIATMLFFTYSNVTFDKIRFSRFHFTLIAFQLVGSALVYLLLCPINVVLAQGAMICVLSPTATSAPVITSMLGGNVETLTAYSLLCNLVIAFVAPVSFALVGNVDSTSFFASVFFISENIFLLLLLPFVAAYLLYKFLPSVHNKIKPLKSISFYLWAFALIVITGKTVLFIVSQNNADYYLEIGIAVVAFAICISQFMIGRYIGKRHDNTIAGGQGLGQKNTILAIWMAQTYLNPISSIAPGAYVLWQNMFNSYQVWRARKNL